MEYNAGAIMDEDMGETKVNAETMNVAAHLRFMDQFFGLAGSSSESHVTRFGSLIDRVDRADFLFSSWGVGTSSSYGMPSSIPNSSTELSG
jgi:hypothetical protein